jgi:hypothetical protein
MLRSHLKAELIDILESCDAWRLSSLPLFDSLVWLMKGILMFDCALINTEVYNNRIHTSWLL